MAGETPSGLFDFFLPPQFLFLALRTFVSQGKPCVSERRVEMCLPHPLGVTEQLVASKFFPAFLRVSKLEGLLRKSLAMGQSP